MKFSALQLAEPIVRAVTDKGYASATEIQAQAIPPALLGHDILGTAQTGTGKTCAFALPILHRLSQSKPVQPVQPVQQVRNKRHDRRSNGRAPRALVLCPTRELATQIHESFLDYGSNLKLGYCVVFGGVSQYHQVRALQRGVDVLIATPGRLKDLVNQGHIDLSKIETLVLDEADRMLDMGFINDIRHIVHLIPGDRQTMLFSATISNSIRRLANDLLNDPTIIETAPEATTVDTIKQRFFMVPQQQKFRLLITLLNKEKVDRALIFTKTKHKADRVARWLQRAGIHADAIHSNKTQSARNAAMRSFREGNVNVLVATDIASRGIDVDNITHVLNFDVPIDPETYVHRIGRTARAGASGTAITFFQANEKQMLRSIERRANITLPPAEQLPRLEEMPELSTDAESSESRTDERRRSPRRNGQNDHRNDRKGRSKKHSGGSNQGGYAPRENRDGDSGKPGGYKKKDFKKNKYQKPSGNTEGYAPRENRDGDSGKPGGYKKKDFKKNKYQKPSGNTEGYAPRENRDNDSGKPGGYKKKFKKNAGGYNKGGYTPRDDRDGDSSKPGGYKKKFKKNADGSNQGGYAPRDDRNGDSGKPGGYKKKFKKSAGGYNKGGYTPRDDRDGDSSKPGGYKKKFKKNAGGSNQGGYVARDGDSGKPGGYKKKKFKKNAGGSNQGGYVARDGDSGKPGGFKKKTFKKNGVKKSGMSGRSKGHRKGQSSKKFAAAQ